MPGWSAVSHALLDNEQMSGAEARLPAQGRSRGTILASVWATRVLGFSLVVASFGKGISATGITLPAILGGTHASWVQEIGVEIAETVLGVSLLRHGGFRPILMLGAMVTASLLLAHVAMIAGEAECECWGTTHVPHWVTVTILLIGCAGTTCLLSSKPMRAQRNSGSRILVTASLCVVCVTAACIIRFVVKVQQSSESERLASEITALGLASRPSAVAVVAAGCPACKSYMESWKPSVSTPVMVLVCTAEDRHDVAEETRKLPARVGGCLFVVGLDGVAWWRLLAEHATPRVGIWDGRTFEWAEK